LEDRLSEMAANQSLVLREPQLQQCLAKRDAAQTVLDKARLDLERTTVLVPFDSMVVEESVEVGHLVDRQNQLATLVGTGEFWVKAAVRLDHLPRVAFPDSDGKGGSEVRVTLRTGREEPVFREGQVVRLLADLAPEGQMARVLVTIRDPLDLQGEHGQEGGRILIGSFVRLEIEAGELEGVCSIPWPALRENDQIWVRTQRDTLQVREVDVVWKRAEDVLVADGVQPGDQLITTRLASVIPEMAVRVAARKSPSEGPGQAAPQPTQTATPVNSRS
jgi:multidrug efflux pump subunit AcrA (membrane-fusion protein)